MPSLLITFLVVSLVTLTTGLLIWVITKRSISWLLLLQGAVDITLLMVAGSQVIFLVSQINQWLFLFIAFVMSAVLASANRLLRRFGLDVSSALVLASGIRAIVVTECFVLIGYAVVIKMQQQLSAGVFQTLMQMVAGAQFYILGRRFKELQKGIYGNTY